METKSFNQKIRHLVLFMGVLVIFSFGCSSPTWQIIDNPQKSTVNLACGEQEVIVYTNTSNKMEYLIFDFNNGCEFSAYTYVLDADTIMDANSQFVVPGYTTRRASYTLSPGESFEATCTLVESVNGTGCAVTYWIRATK